MSATLTTGILLVAVGAFLAGRLVEALRTRKRIEAANTRADDALLLMQSYRRHAERLQAEASLLDVEGPVLVVGPAGVA